MKTQQFYTAAEAADLLDISRQHIYKLIERGDIKAFKRIGKPVQIPAEEVQRALKPFEVGG